MSQSLLRASLRSGETLRSLQRCNANKIIRTFANPGGNTQSTRPYSFPRSARYLSTEPPQEKPETPAEEKPVEPNESADSDAKLRDEIKILKDQLLRSLAEQENTRRIAKKDVESAKSFAITSFAKSLLETSDNLSRAMDSVPLEQRTGGDPVLATLYEGIQMTDDGLTKALERNGLVKYGKVGDVFDPNLYNALYEYEDEKGMAGTVGQVMKVGFKLKGRTIRPVECGVVKKKK